MIFGLDVSSNKRRIRISLGRPYLEVRHWPKSKNAFGHRREFCPGHRKPCGHRLDLFKFSIYWEMGHA